MVRRAQRVARCQARVMMGMTLGVGVDENRSDDYVGA